MILGGDYSLYDNILDWVNHNWKYAFIKVSEGIVEDPMFKEQWAAAKGYVYRGGYHFFRPLVPWKAAAEKFMLLMDREGLGELPAVLDFEVTNGVANNKICEYGLEWLRYIHRETGQKPIVYTSPGFSNTIQMFRYPDFADYLLWEATYPWDKIDANWSEEQRRETIHAVIMGTQRYIFPVAARPWEDVGRKPTFAQWTGKCPPEYVPGYPLGHKLAVDVNYYRGSLQDLIFQFNLPELEGGTVSTKPITWTATLKASQPANLRTGAGLSASVKEQILANRTLEFKGTGTKLSKDNFFWGEVVTIDGIAKSGWIAFTTSFMNVTWLENPPPPVTQKKPIRTAIFYDDGSVDEMFPK